MRGRGRVAWWALLAILVSSTAALAQTNVFSPPAPIEVPGGIAAIARFVGHVDQDPRRFVVSLESELLGSTQSDHDWTAIPQRSELMRFLDFIGELERRFPGEIRLGPDGAERRTLERLADALGFDLQRDARQGFVVLPKGERDDEQAFRRRAAHALGLELERAGDRLDRGESWTIAIPAADRADSPLSPQVWQALVGKPPGRDALAVLVADQRLGLLLEGRDHWSRETRDALDGLDLREIYDRAPFAFRRYAPAFAIEDGRLVVPGGEAALPAWRAMVGASSDAPSSLVAALLLERRAKGAYLWHALRFAPPAARMAHG